MRDIDGFQPRRTLLVGRPKGRRLSERGKLVRTRDESESIAVNEGNE